MNKQFQEELLASEQDRHCFFRDSGMAHKYQGESIKESLKMSQRSKLQLEDKEPVKRADEFAFYS